MPFEIGLDPVAFRLDGLAVHWYGIIVALAGAVAVVVAVREARRLEIGREVAEDGVVWVVIAALAGGRALYILQNQLDAVARDP